MPKSVSGSQDLFDRIERLAEGAGRDSPSSYELLDIASDSDALVLIELMDKLVAARHANRSIVIYDCLLEVISAIEAYSNEQAWSPSSSVNFARQLRNARDKDIAKILDQLLSNPTNSQDVLVAIYRGALDAGVIATRTKGGIVEERVIVPGKRSSWVHGDFAWLTELRAELSLLKLAINAIPDVKLETRKVSLMRRLRELRRKPTAKRLDALLVEAEKLGSVNYILSAMRYVVSTSLYQTKPLPGDWIAILKNDPAKLARVAAGTLELLIEVGDPLGRKSNPNLDQYGDRVAEAWMALTGTDISYATSTETRPNRGLEARYGPGLKFMHLAMKLINASATKNQARAQIDRIRGWAKRNKRNL